MHVSMWRCKHSVVVAVPMQVGDFQAWNSCLSHILALATSHMESVMVDAFLKAVYDCIDADCKRALKVQCGS